MAQCLRAQNTCKADFEKNDRQDQLLSTAGQPERMPGSQQRGLPDRDVLEACEKYMQLCSMGFDN